MYSKRKEPFGDPLPNGTAAETPQPGDRRGPRLYGSPPPGTSVTTVSGDLVLLGRTGDGRYAFIRDEEYGKSSGPRPSLRILGRLEAEMALGLRPIAPRDPADRRGRWAGDR